MVSYPHTHLFHGELKTVAISGPHIQVLDSNSGELLRSTVTLDGEKLDAVLKSGPVRCATVDSEYAHIATAGDDKQFKVWAIDSLQLLSERELPKKPTQIAFTRSGRTIVVTDKFGDVFSYPITPLPTPTQMPSQNTDADTLASHENPSGGTLILGHTSLLTTFLLSPDETHIITADRDEHIRVSWFPQGHTIESFCLGHKKFISAIHTLQDPVAGDLLISGGGDPVLKVWQWRIGRRLYDVAIEESVLPFIAVRRARPMRGYDGDGERKPPSRRWLARQRRREAKAAAAATATTTRSEDIETARGVEETAETEAEAEVQVEAAGDDEDERDESGDEEGDLDASPATPSGEPGGSLAPVLVVQKIETSNINERLVVVFSAVGATALFWFGLPPDPTAVSEGLLIIHAHDFGHPIVTFAPIAGNPDLFFVSLDAHWNDEGSSPGVSSPVRLVRLGLDSASDLSPLPPLLSTLNGASIIPANEREFSALHLYEPLTSLPKNIDATHNPMIREEPDSDVANTMGNRGAKAAGKLRTRMALLARDVQEEPPVKRTKGEEMVEGDEVMDET